MSEELEWYTSESDADSDSDDLQASASKGGATTESRGFSVPSDSKQEHSGSIRQTDREGGSKDSPRMTMREQRAVQSMQQKWKKKTGDIYGAQACPGLFCTRSRLSVVDFNLCWHCARAILFSGICCPTSHSQRSAPSHSARCTRDLSCTHEM